MMKVMKEQKYKCGHKSKGIFVNNDTCAFAVHKVWLDKINSTKEKCFECYCKENKK